MLLNFLITFEVLVICLPSMSFMKLEKNNNFTILDSATDTETLENGVDLYLSNFPNSSDPLESSISCIRSLNYRTVFLYLWDADGFRVRIAELAKTLTEGDIQVEYVLSPLLPSSVTPDSLISSILAELDYFGLSPNFIWLNVLNSGEDVNLNIKYLQDLRSALQERNIRIGIVTIPDLWKFYYDNWAGPSAEKDLLWVDIVLDEIDEFEEFGGWSKVSVISPTTVTQCDLKFGNLTYRKEDIDSHFSKKVSSTMSFSLLYFIIIGVYSFL